MMRMKNAIDVVTRIAHNDYKDVSDVLEVKSALLIKLLHIAHNDYKDGKNAVDAIDQVTSPSKSNGALHCAAIFSFRAFVLRSLTFLTRHRNLAR